MKRNWRYTRNAIALWINGARHATVCASKPGFVMGACKRTAREKIAQARHMRLYTIREGFKLP